MSRTFNGALSDISLRFEIEQLANSQYVRPLRENKLARKHNIKVNLSSGEVNEYPEHEYQPIEEQKAINDPDDWVLKHTVSKQTDRGKPKNSKFQKKHSYSLIPKSGIFPIFKGRFQDRLTEHVSIGFLHDARKMLLLGEKYVWLEGVRTSGINGYFWLSNDKDVKPVSDFPGLQSIRDTSYCKNLEELKNQINNNGIEVKKRNEILACGSIDSLAAIYVTKNDTIHLLAALHAQCILHHDYNIQRNIAILDGESEPKVCSKNELKQIFRQAKQQQCIWWRKLLNFFFPSIKQQLLSAIQRLAINNPQFNFLYLEEEEKNSEEIPGDLGLKLSLPLDQTNKQTLIMSSETSVKQKKLFSVTPTPKKRKKAHNIDDRAIDTQECNHLSRNTELSSGTSIINNQQNNPLIEVKSPSLGGSNHR